MYDRIIVIGSGVLAVKIAEYLINHGEDTSVFEYHLSDYSSVKFMCGRKNINYTSFDKNGLAKRLMEEANNRKLLIISAVNIYIFPKCITSHPNVSIINYHNSLLPKHRGMNAEAWSIYEMDSETGITWHFADEHIDTGNIIAQVHIKIGNSTTSLQLLKLQSAEAFKSFCEFFEKLHDGNLKGYRQSDNICGEIHRIKSVPNDGIINLGWSVEKIYAFLRALDYGKIETLGRPKIKIGEKYYSCAKYRMCEFSVISLSDTVSISNKVASIRKKGTNKGLILGECQICK